MVDALQDVIGCVVAAEGGEEFRSELPLLDFSTPQPFNPEPQIPDFPPLMPLFFAATSALSLEP